MKDNTQEKNLIERNENSIFGKIKNSESKVTEDILAEAEKSNGFRDNIKMTENEEVKLFELQRKYRRGEIADGDLTQEQINSLCMLYDKQIEDLKKTIESKEHQISKYKKINNRK